MQLSMSMYGTQGVLKQLWLKYLSEKLLFLGKGENNSKRGTVGHRRHVSETSEFLFCLIRIQVFGHADLGFRSIDLLFESHFTNSNNIHIL